MAKVKSKEKTRIIKAKIEFISLCPKGANTLSTIYKAENGDENVDLTTICKEMNEQGEITCCVYAPELWDSQDDIASAAVIKEFAYDFSKNGAGVDIQHNGVVLDRDDVFVAETMIIQKGDPRFSDMVDYEGNQVDVTGGWGAILKVESEDLKELYRSGEWSGVSMGGTANKQPETDAIGIIKIFKQILKSCIPTTNKTEKNTENKTMALSKEDKKEVAELVTTTITEINKKTEEEKAEKIKKAEAEKAEKIKKAEAEKAGLGLKEPVLKASPTKEELEEHRRRLEIYELSKTVNTKDSRAIFKFQQRAIEIATSKDLEKTLQKQGQDQYASYFTTNQTTEEINKDTEEEDNDGGVSVLINKNLDEEEKAKLKIA